MQQEVQIYTQKEEVGAQDKNETPNINSATCF